MKRSIERILTTHVGSLPRPTTLTDLATYDSPPKDPVLYQARVREAGAEIVRRQASAGIDIINDGEFGKSSWANYILERISGFEFRPEQKKRVEWLGRDIDRFAEALEQSMPGITAPRSVDACIAEITTAKPEAIHRAVTDLIDALEDVTVEEAFMTAVAPASAAYSAVNEYYANDHDYIFALADVLRHEYRAIHEAGLLVQVDDAVLANMYDTLVQRSPAEYRRWAALRIEALNHALEGIPADRVRYHVCFGSWHVPHVADAPLEEIVDLILEVNADAYSIEAANPRHAHEWRVWQNGKLPKHKILIPGVITHHIITVEHPRVVADRIVQFAELVGRENVIAGTDCGFAQSDSVQRVHPSVMWAKFDSLVEGARIATRELWGRA